MYRDHLSADAIHLSLCVLACFVFERWSLTGLRLMVYVRQAGPRDLLPVSASRALGYKHHYHSSLFTWFLGLELTSSYLNNKHFTN